MNTKISRNHRAKSKLYFYLILTLILIFINHKHHSWHAMLKMFDSSNDPYSYQGLASNPILQFVVLYLISFMCFLFYKLSYKGLETEKKQKLYIGFALGLFVFGSYILMDHWQFIQMNFYSFYAKLFSYNFSISYRYTFAPFRLALYAITLPIVAPLAFYIRQKRQRHNLFKDSKGSN